MYIIYKMEGVPGTYRNRIVIDQLIAVIFQEICFLRLQLIQVANSILAGKTQMLWKLHTRSIEYIIQQKVVSLQHWVSLKELATGLQAYKKANHTLLKWELRTLPERLSATAQSAQTGPIIEQEELLKLTIQGLKI